jgi:hypothetical protein
MDRPSKADIKAALEKLKGNAPQTSGSSEQAVGKLSPKKSSQRIRKQGV